VRNENRSWQTERTSVRQQTNNLVRNQAEIFGIDKIDKSDANVTTASIPKIHTRGTGTDLFRRELFVLASNAKTSVLHALQGVQVTASATDPTEFGEC
jgi:hypothetical protein